MFSQGAHPRAVQETGQAVPFGIPIRGLNARDSAAIMDPRFALVLVNALCDQTGLRTPLGFTQWATDLGNPGDGPVHTVMLYYPAGADPATPTGGFGGKVFAARAAAVYDVTAGGAAAVVAGINSPGPFWTWRMFQNAAGSFLVMCNDAGAYRYYNGTAWSVVVAGAGVGEIDGVNPDNLCFVMEFKKRLWFIEKDSTRAWYLPVGQLTGVATVFDFGESFQRGGKLVSLVNWTVDGGTGIDDYLVAVGSQGSVSIYQGTDPATATTFNIRGVWNVGPLPTGRRSVTQHGGDVNILSQLGVTPLSKLLAAKKVEDPSVNLSYYIDPLVSTLMKTYSGLPGWQLADVPKEGLVLVGVPLSAGLLGGDFLVVKLATGAWSILRGFGYTSFANADGVVYAGTADGRVVLAFNGALLNAIPGLSPGEAIVSHVTPAYQSLGRAASVKNVLMMRPTFLASFAPSVRFKMLYNYRQTQVGITPTLAAAGGDLWNVGLWNSAKWGGTAAPFQRWYGATGSGVAATPQLSYASGGDSVLANIDLWVDADGGVL